MKLAPCIKTLKRVIKQHDSLTNCFHDQPLTPEQKALCYGVMRWYLQLDFVLQQLLHEPLKDKNLPVALHVYIGLFQLLHGDMPSYAVVKEVVDNIKQSKFRWAAGLVNKVLRKAIDEKASLLKAIEANPVARFSHPQWMINRLDEKTLVINNQQAPLTLRVNLQKTSKNDYLKKLTTDGLKASSLTTSSTAIQLETAVTVENLPGFFEGLCSVQDEAGQLLADRLDLKPGMRVLDACCAPGSKTCHILETEPNLSALVALDIDETRLKKVAENFNRLALATHCVSLIAADAGDTASWWDGQLFDRILIDAPCSASGVIRRHPDIKHLRRESDLQLLAQRQIDLLNTLSPLLADKGVLIYSTCSTFSEENHMVVQRFLHEHKFKLINELTLLPEKNGHDGFYIATLGL